MRVLGVLCSVWAASRAVADDPEAEAGNIVVKFPGKSGKFRIFSKGDENGTSSVEIRVGSVTEVDSTGNKIPQHTVNGIASQDFSFTEDPNASLDNVSAHKITFETELEKANQKFGEIKVDTYLMTEAGEVGPNMSDPESLRWSVSAGTLKFAIELSGWDWDSDGAAVDVELEVKTNDKPKKKESNETEGNETEGKGREDVYDLSGGSALKLAAEITVDGEGREMASGYPKFEEKDNKQIFTFRFPKFDDNALYDPVLEVGNGEDGSSVTDGPPVADDTKESDSGADSGALGIMGFLPLALPALYAAVV